MERDTDKTASIIDLPMHKPPSQRKYKYFLVKTLDNGVPSAYELDIPDDWVGDGDDIKLVRLDNEARREPFQFVPFQQLPSDLSKDMKLRLPWMHL